MKNKKWKDGGRTITRIEALIVELESKGIVWNNNLKKPQNRSFILSQSLRYLISGCLTRRYNIAEAEGEVK